MKLIGSILTLIGVVLAMSADHSGWLPVDLFEDGLMIVGITLILHGWGWLNRSTMVVAVVAGGIAVIAGAANLLFSWV